MTGKKAILITYNRRDAQGEALGLCNAAGYDIIHTMQQRYLRRPRYGIGAGALENLKSLIEDTGPDVIIYDEVIKPSQNYNLASAINMEILDRESLILEIFESRASSAESRLQVRIAKLRYEMARAKERVRLSSMGEQPGFMGIGKFGVDVYYNDIKHRMNTAKTKLKKEGKRRELHRRARKRAGFSTVSLAGYTSAGKTTLFNAMTGEEKSAGAELFTTLSTTTRRTTIDGTMNDHTHDHNYNSNHAASDAVLISDTVGFISKLPAYMIDAFRSTLEELVYADVVILVIDASDDHNILKKKVSSCRGTLAEIGVNEGRVLYALNKSDLAVDKTDIIQKAEALGIMIGYDDDDASIQTVTKKDGCTQDAKRWVAVSARTGENIEELRQQIGKMLVTRDASRMAKTTSSIDVKNHNTVDIGWSEPKGIIQK